MNTYTVTWISIIYNAQTYQYIDGSIKLQAKKDLKVSEVDELARDIIKVKIADEYNPDRIFKLYITNVD